MKNVFDLFSLKGKVALVTGGAGHLGSAISQALSEAGARVVVASRNLEHCRNFVSQLPGEATAMELDIADEKQIRDTIDAVTEWGGSIDVLVNCAYSGPVPNVDEATGKDFDDALHLTVTPYFIASQQAARHMRRTGGGSIIQIGSMYGVVGSYPAIYEGLPVNSPPNYHAGKGGLIQLTRYLAVYWAPHNIRVNTISPGPFPRNVQREGNEIFLARMREKVPLGRLGKPWELKGAALFLASEASNFVTGHNLLVDGGWTAW